MEVYEEFTSLPEAIATHDLDDPDLHATVASWQERLRRIMNEAERLRRIMNEVEGLPDGD